MDTTMLIKTNKALKTEAQNIARGMGLPLTTIINAQLIQFVRDRKIEFDSTFTLNPRAAKRMRNSLKDFEEGKNIIRHDSVDDFLAQLGK